MLFEQNMQALNTFTQNFKDSLSLITDHIYPPSYVITWTVDDVYMGSTYILSADSNLILPSVFQLSVCNSNTCQTTTSMTGTGVQ